MPLNWEELKISQAELDNIFDPDIMTIWAISVSRVFLLRQRKYRQSLLLAQSSLLFISILFGFPISLMIFRKLEFIVNNSSGLIIVLLSTISLSLILLIIFNYFLWLKAKRLKLISKLLEKTTNYNNLLKSFQLLVNINQLNNKNSKLEPDSESNRLNLDKLKTILKLTKNTLLNSIELEGLIYKHQQNNQLNHHQLLATLEHNLIDLSLPETNSDREYQELLNEAVDLGLSVHQEIRKINKFS
jgi:hypothetical protein